MYMYIQLYCLISSSVADVDVVVTECDRHVHTTSTTNIDLEEDKSQKGQGETLLLDSDQALSPNSVPFPPFHVLHT